MTLVILYGFDPFTIALIVKVKGGGGLGLPTAILRLFRLARLTRLVRMLRSFPELMVMIKGMITATASVVYTLGLLMMITYVFAIALRNLAPSGSERTPAWCDEHHPDGMGGGCIEVKYFSSVPEAMHNLIIFGTFADELADFMWAVKSQSSICMIVTWIYISLAGLTVMNMLVGVLCEVISAVATEEQESVMVDQVFEKFGAIMEDMDGNRDGKISWDEFKSILEIPAALEALESVNVEAESMVDLAEDLFWEDGEPFSVSFDDFIGMVLDLRGGQEATVQNVMGLGKRFSQKFIHMTGKVDGLEHKVDTAADKMQGVGSKLEQILSHLKADVTVSSPP